MFDGDVGASLDLRGDDAFPVDDDELWRPNRLLRFVTTFLVSLCQGF